MASLKTDNSAFKISAIKAFSDNYIWAITNETMAGLVDPGDADTCIRYIEANKLTLSTILITHHHPDHTGGIEGLLNYCQKNNWPLTVYGPANENIPHCDIKLIESDEVNLPALNINLQVIDLPGHTAGHIAYFSSDSEITNKEPVLFCGDTLFSGGCGRLFEGSPAQMLHSLTKLAHLPDNTKVYCAHEYTQANLTFAKTVEPDNQALIHYSEQVKNLRAKNLATIPTTIKVEKQINPFLRCHIPTLQNKANHLENNVQANSLDTFTKIRRWKDQF